MTRGRYHPGMPEYTARRVARMEDSPLVENPAGIVRATPRTGTSFAEDFV